MRQWVGRLRVKKGTSNLREWRGDLLFCFALGILLSLIRWAKRGAHLYSESFMIA